MIIHKDTTDRPHKNYKQIHEMNQEELDAVHSFVSTCDESSLPDDKDTAWWSFSRRCDGKLTTGYFTGMYVF